MAHIHDVIDTDIHYKIDGITRNITNINETKRTLVQYDHNSERLTFEVPRYIDGHDLTTCNRVQVHYINIDIAGKEKNLGIYDVDDIGVKSDDENVVAFTWLISNNATKYAGTISFIIRFACVDEDGTVSYVWNTLTFKSIFVSDGICNSEVIVENYADILEQWENKLFDSKMVDVNITGLGDDYGYTTPKYITSVEFNDLYNVLTNNKNVKITLTQPDGTVELYSVIVCNWTFSINEDGIHNIVMYLPITNSSVKKPTSVSIDEKNNVSINYDNRLDSLKADDILYDNTNSGLESNNVQDAIDELSDENDALSDKLDAVSGIVFESWSDIQKIVRKGLAPSVFNIGDQFVTQDNYTGEEMVWDIIGFDCDTPVDSNYTHSMTIQLHDCYKFDFDAPEAAYVINSELVAGQYYFTFGGTNYSFTLDMPRYYPGCQIVFNPVKDPNTVYTYEGFYSAAPYIESTTVSIDTAEGTFLEEVNDYGRMRHGSNDWSKASVRLWLNSDNSDPNNWWIPDMVTPHSFDRPPQINSGAGFLCHLDPELLAVLGKVKKETYLATNEKMTETEDLMFLLSKSEINESIDAEGKPYPFYKNTNSLGRIKRFNDGSVCRIVALRTANKDTMCSVWAINEVGACKRTYANNTFGIAPACCIV